MSLDDFRHYFSLLFVCKYNDDYVFNSLGFHYDKTGWYLFKMSVSHAGEYTIAISQKDKRCFPLSSNYNYSSCSISVAKVGTDGSPKVLKGEQGFMERDTYVEFLRDAPGQLEQGDYFVWVKMDWHDTIPRYES